MEPWSFSDGNITGLLESRRFDPPQDVNQRLQMHSSLVQRLALEKDMEGHEGCVNTIAWNSKGTLLISGSDDTRINIWSYSNRKLMHSIDTGHSGNIFCTKFVPETRDELVVSGAADDEVRLFNISRLRGGRSRSSEDNILEPSAVFQCHSKRVKKLAVEIGNPNVLWSASEDGTLRQHDFREGASCCNQECHSVLLDLRFGAKKSLASPPKQCLALKSCDISSARPHQILVGGSDAFARLYDRRMLPPLSSCRTSMKPPPCVSYFCPMHLSGRRGSRLHLTHVTFSPDGEEVLLSYSGEHVYLMNVNSGKQSMGYTVDDVGKLFCLSPSSEELGLPSPPSSATSYYTGSKNNLKRLDMYKKLVQAAENFLNEGSNFLYGIEACNEVLDGKGPDVGKALKHECLCIRAALFLKRKWKNDVHMAIRDCNKARGILSSSFKAHYYMSEALSQIGKHKEALDYAVAAQNIAPSDPQASERVLSIRDRLAAAEEEKKKKAEAEKKKKSEAEKNKENGGTRKGDVRRGRIRSLSDLLLRSEINNEESQEGSNEDSDFEEMEVDFETAISDDEDHDIESSIVRGSLNFRFHRNREHRTPNGSQGSPSSSSQHGSFINQPEIAVDMRQRYVGHCNIGTDIKQASFLGQQGEFVASGSDDGKWFIWEKKTGRLIKMLAGDNSVVNCVQCHPFDCVVATSGIDDTIKIWTPRAEIPFMVAGGTAGPENADVLTAVESNQQALCSSNREAVLPFEFWEQIRNHDFEFAEGTVPPFQCAQS